jgi:hypothetical protein
MSSPQQPAWDKKKNPWRLPQSAEQRRNGQVIPDKRAVEVHAEWSLDFATAQALSLNWQMKLLSIMGRIASAKKRIISQGMSRRHETCHVSLEVASSRVDVATL